jgi:hypothetical protein
LRPSSRALGSGDATGANAAVFDLDGADERQFALMAALATPRDRVVFAAARDFGFIDLDEAAKGLRPSASMLQLSADQSHGLAGAESELALRLRAEIPLECNAPIWIRSQRQSGWESGIVAMA